MAAVRQQIISIHALREEGDNSFQCSQSSRLDFYPRPPRGGRPYVAGYVTKKTYDFYPRPPRGGRLRHSSKLQQDKGYFYPRPPRGGRLCIPCACWLCPRFLSTPSARRATAHKCPHCAGLHISIHALREEGDYSVTTRCSNMADFYPRPPRGGRHSKSGISAANVQISIHALREEGDIDPTDVCVDLIRFLSTPSARRATALLFGVQINAIDFYPRPPRGGRR